MKYDPQMLLKFICNPQKI